MFVCPVPKISQVMIKWRRRASHLGRFTLWHNGCRATQLVNLLCDKTAAELHNSVDLLCGTTAAELQNSVDLPCGTTACKRQEPHTFSEDSKGGFPLSRNFYVRTDVNFNWLYVRKLK